jgi:hypothetical protein
MMVTFESDVGRITMFGDTAQQLIRMMGRPGTIPSALLAADVPEALAALRNALEEADLDEAARSGGDEENSGKPAVSMRQRAFPLIKLLEDAEHHGSDVMWEYLGSGPLQF